MRRSVVCLVFLTIEMTSVSFAAEPDFWASDAVTATTVKKEGKDDVTLESLVNPVEEVKTAIPDLRIEMLREAGETVGFRGGMIARSKILCDYLEYRAGQLDKMYDFTPLISIKGTLPPVIVEAREVNAYSTDQIRTATRIYKIQRKERFVSNPPTWRDYLIVGLTPTGSVEMPVADARAKNSDEEIIWREAVKRGWKKGEHQADDILVANFARVTRDYTGMMRYSDLLQLGMVTTTDVAESQRTVTATPTQLTIGDTLKRLLNPAVFKVDPNEWMPVITDLNSHVESFQAQDAE